MATAKWRDMYPRIASNCSPIHRVTGALVVGLAAVSLASAQGQLPRQRPMRPEGLVSFGIVTGGELRDWFNSVQNGSTIFDDKSGHFMIGPTLQIHPTPRYTLEFDALRRGFGVRTSGNILGVGFSSTSSGNSWEFPVLVKRRFYMARHVKTFIGAGISVRHLSQFGTLTSTTNSANTMNSSQGSNTFGIPIAAGFEFRGSWFRFSPELRYTLWTADKTLAPVRVPGLFDANPNQVAFIMSFTLN
jgi:hypothetical protein